MQKLRPGLWHWTAAHPDWSPEERWPQMVSSYAIDDGTSLLLVDPQTVPDELLAQAANRETLIVLTAPWHERDTRALVDRLGLPVYAPHPDTPETLMAKFDLTREQVGDGSPDLNWLLAGGGTAHWYKAGDRLPMGIETFLGREDNDLVVYSPAHRAVISGDTIVDFGRGYEINLRVKTKVSREDVAARLRPLLDRPVDLLLSAHGAPTDRAELERLLAPDS